MRVGAPRFGIMMLTGRIIVVLFLSSLGGLLASAVPVIKIVQRRLKASFLVLVLILMNPPFVTTFVPKVMNLGRGSPLYKVAV